MYEIDSTIKLEWCYLNFDSPYSWMYAILYWDRGEGIETASAMILLLKKVDILCSNHLFLEGKWLKITLRLRDHSKPVRLFKV